MINFKRFFLFANIFAMFFFVSCNIEPFEGEIPEEIDSLLPETCEAAASATGDAAINFASVSPSDLNYPDFCNVYKVALNSQISVCGDEGGAFQSLVDGLGDCKVDETINANEDYWPMSKGNTWTYAVEVTDMPNSESIMEISNLVDYQGKSSYLYENFFGSIQATDGERLENLQDDFYTRKRNGKYEVLVGQSTAEFGGLYRITQSEYDFVILKDNVDVGSTWDYNFDVITSYEPLKDGGFTLPNAIANYYIKLEILEKNASVESGGKTYDSVIKVKFIQKVVLSGFFPQAFTSEYIYYFAKGVGLVKSEGTVFDADDNITSNVSQELTASIIN